MEGGERQSCFGCWDSRASSLPNYHQTILKLCFAGPISSASEWKNTILAVCEGEVGETCQTRVVCCRFRTFLRHHFLLTLRRNPPGAAPVGEYSTLL